MFCSRLAVAAAIALWLVSPSLAQSPQPPAQPPAQSQPGQTPPPPPPAQPAPVQSADPFGQEVTLEAKPILSMKGTANWDSAYDTLIDAFKSLNGFVEKQGLKQAGPPITIYTSTDDTGFQYQVGIPLTEEPKNPPRGDIALAKSPAGRALKFVHRGSYDAMDTTYEAITNYLDEKKLEAKDMFIEEYVTDPVKTPEDKLVVNVFVPIQ
jgi:effector-binding domain-containing protein